MLQMSGDITAAAPEFSRGTDEYPSDGYPLEGGILVAWLPSVSRASLSLLTVR